MPVNKNLLIRILTLDRCFRDWGKEYYIEDLIEACNESLASNNAGGNKISKRSLYYDIDFMKSEEGFDAPIEKRKGENNRVYYRYSDRHYSILGKFLPQDVVQLSRTMVEFLTYFEGMAPMEEIRSQLPELKKLYRIKENDPIVEFDFNFDYTGLQWFGKIFSSIINHIPLWVEYESYQLKKTDTFIFHPCYLKSYMHRWYAIGYNESEQTPYWVMGLERIKNIKELNDRPFIEKHGDLKEYFYDVVGVTRPQGLNPMEIELHVHPDFEKYLTSRPFHPSQKNKGLTPEGWRILTLEVILNNELVNHLMPYIHYIKIIRPDVLKERVKERLTLALELSK